MTALTESNPPDSPPGPAHPPQLSDTLDDLRSNHDPVPHPLAERQYSGEFRVRIPPELHRQLAMAATEQGVSLNRLASAK